jgi:two-component system response regulator FixJ
MKCGAIDLLEKPFDDDELLSSIRSALYRHERDVRYQLERSEIHARLGALTERERQVLEGLLAGRPNKTIGYDLSITPQKVEVHRASLMTKMQATNLSRLVRMALVAGLIGAGG